MYGTMHSKKEIQNDSIHLSIIVCITDRLLIWNPQHKDMMLSFIESHLPTFLQSIECNTHGSIYFHYLVIIALVLMSCYMATCEWIHPWLFKCKWTVYPVWCCFSYRVYRMFTWIPKQHRYLFLFLGRFWLLRSLFTWGWPLHIYHLPMRIKIHNYMQLALQMAWEIIKQTKLFTEEELLLGPGQWPKITCRFQEQ